MNSNQRAESDLQFDARLQRPAAPGAAAPWTFVVLPKAVSEQMPRRGRLTVDGSLNGCAFRAMLEPDGQLSHWLPISEELRMAAGVAVGDRVSLRLAAVDPQPDPEVPGDLGAALHGDPAARAGWDATTTIARVDWIHWITSAKQATTRAKRVKEACDKLAAGNRRVCCFDVSGFYSKAFGAPRALDADE